MKLALSTVLTLLALTVSITMWMVRLEGGIREMRKDVEKYAEIQKVHDSWLRSWMEESQARLKSLERRRARSRE